MSEFRLGAHLVTNRLAYTHHGIYIGRGMVIHYTGFHKFPKKGIVKKTTLKEFASGHNVKEYDLTHLLRGKRFTPNEVVERAKSRLNEDSYNLVFNNCEHFANWCTHGDKYSVQTEGTAEYNIRSEHYFIAGGLTIFDLTSLVKNIYKIFNK